MPYDILILNYQLAYCCKQVVNNTVSNIFICMFLLICRSKELNDFLKYILVKNPEQRPTSAQMLEVCVTAR